MIRLDDVTKVHRTHRVETTALSNVTLAVERGEIVSVMGPSGCGKSTLLNLMGLLDAPTSGEIVLDGARVSGLGDRALARRRNETIGFVFQSFHLVADLSVLDNVEIPLLYRRGVGGRERRAMAREALEGVGLGSRVDHFPGQLSGGQQQRVAIARAVVGRPPLLLADEPTGNLDSHMGGEVMEILETLNREAGTTVVLVTHDEALAKRAGRTIRLFDGRQVQ